MAEKENKRKCFKCGCSPAEDNIKLFRFPKPAIRNLVRCELWAKYIFPERGYSYTLPMKLHNEHRMLCQKHFNDADFTDESKGKLLRTAVPYDITHNLLQDPVAPMAGPSHQSLLPDVTNIEGRNDTQIESTYIFGDDDDAVNVSDALVDANVENTDLCDEDDAEDDSDALVDSNVCRVCLTLDVKMYDLKDIELREMFQNVTGIAVTENKHSILERLCWECAGRLKAAAGFRNKALLSDALLQGLANTGEQIQKSYITTIKENADYLKTAGTLSVVEVFRSVEIEPENESVPPTSENNDTAIVQNIARNDWMELADSVFEDGHYQMDLEHESIIEGLSKPETENNPKICPNTGTTKPVVVKNVPYREDTINLAYSSPRVKTKKRILGYPRKTSSDCEDMTKRPVIKITKSDLISKIVYRKSNPVISQHVLTGGVKLKNINVKVGGICKKASNLKLAKKS